MLVKILTIAFPVLLFLFKYILPIIAEAAYSDKSINISKVIEELLEFPLDMMFIAISYIVPKIIEALSLDAQAQNGQSVLHYLTISLVMLLLLPFLVFCAKLAVKWHYQKRNCLRNILCIILYGISIICIAVSLFLY